MKKPKKLIFPVVIMTIAFIMGYIFKKSEFYQNNFNAKISIVFEKNAVDFGEIKLNKKMSTYFVYSNEGNKFSKIDKIETSCGCTVPEWNEEKVNPNSKDSVFVEFDSVKLGEFDSEIHVYYEDNPNPKILSLKGNVIR